MSGKLPKMRRRWAVLLIASLALNLLIVGAAVGIYANWPRHQAWQAQRFLGPAGLGLVARSLDERQRRSLGERIAANGQDFDEMRRTGQENLLQMVAVLNAEPFDPAALEAQFSIQQDAAAFRLRQGHELLADAIRQMTPEERRALAERLEEKFRRGRKK